MEINDTHTSLHEVHPILGKFFLLTTIMGLVAGILTLQNIAYVVSICGGILTTCYYGWRWRKEYKEDKEFQKRNKRNGK